MTGIRSFLLWKTSCLQGYVMSSGEGKDEEKVTEDTEEICLTLQ